MDSRLQKKLPKIGRIDEVARTILNRIRRFEKFCRKT